MKNKLLYAGVVLVLFSCSSTKSISNNQSQPKVDDKTFLITEISTDPTYGLSPENPVDVGGVKDSQGPQNEKRYLNALTGPNGESISYYRASSCCPIKSDNAMIGDKVLLDNYRVSWKGSEDTVSIYINMYDSNTLKAPVGFGLKKN